MTLKLEIICERGNGYNWIIKHYEIYNDYYKCEEVLIKTYYVFTYSDVLKMLNPKNKY